MPDAPEHCTVERWESLSLGPTHFAAVNPRLNLPGWVLVQTTDEVKKGKYRYTIRRHNEPTWSSWSEASDSILHDWITSQGQWRKTYDLYRRFGLDILIMHRPAEPLDAPVEPGASEEEY